jgi:hypothetical protein
MDAKDKQIERAFMGKFNPRQRLIADSPEGRVVIQVPDWDPKGKTYEAEIDFQLPEHAQEWVDMLSGDERKYAEAACNWILTNSPIPKVPKGISAVKAMLLFYHAQSVCGKPRTVYLRPEREEENGEGRTNGGIGKVVGRRFCETGSGDYEKIFEP